MYANAQDDTEVQGLSDLLSIWTHDGLSPLTVVKGFSDLLHEGYIGPLNQQQKTTIHTIRLSAQTVIDSWNELVDYFHKATLKPSLSANKLTTDEFHTLRNGIIDPAITTLKTIQAQTARLLNQTDGELTTQQFESLEAVHRACFSAIQRWHDPLDYFAN